MRLPKRDTPAGETYNVVVVVPVPRIEPHVARQGRRLRAIDGARFARIAALAGNVPVAPLQRPACATGDEKAHARGGDVKMC